VVCWGKDDYAQAPSTPSADSYKAIAAGFDHTCGIRIDDKVVCWGSSLFGQAPKL